jgi:hypothetical protein
MTTATRPTGRKVSTGSTGSKAPAKKSAKASSTPSAGQESRNGSSLPVLVPELHVRHVPLPRMGAVSMPSLPSMKVPGPTAVRERMPEPKRMVWFGGLAGLAALGVIHWPVAGVVAVGTYVAERRAKDAIREEFAATESSEE